MEILMKDNNFTTLYNKTVKKTGQQILILKNSTNNMYKCDGRVNAVYKPTFQYQTKM